MDDALQEGLRKVIEDFLSNQENTGSQAGGSGHMGEVSVAIEELEVEEKGSQNYQYQVSIEYIKTVETEFTYYPDNPPIEETYSQIFYIDEELKIIGFSKKEFESTTMDIGELPLDFDDIIDNE